MDEAQADKPVRRTIRPYALAKEIARYMRQADAPLDAHQVVTLYLFLKARFGVEA